MNNVFMMLENIRPNFMILMEPRLLSHKGEVILSALGHDKWSSLKEMAFLGEFGWLKRVII